MKRPLLTMALILAVCLLMVFAVRRSQETLADGATQEAKMGDETIEYTVGRLDSGRAVVEFQYDHETANAVREVAAAMTEQTREELEDGDTVQGEIVFKHPVPLEEYNALMGELGLIPVMNRIEGETWGGGWMGLTAPSADDGRAVDSEALEQTMEHDKDGTQIVGVVTAIGFVLDPSTFERLVDDPRVFAVPSMASWIDNEIVVRYPEVNVTRMYVQQSLLYGWMKMTGIAKPYVHLDYTGTFRKYPYSDGDFRLAWE